MSKAAVATSPSTSEADRHAVSPRCGRVVRLDNNGTVFVEFSGGPPEPVAARLAMSATEIGDLMQGASASEVLLVFDGNDLSRPIIVGIVRDRLPLAGVEITVRGKRFTVATDEEVELRCGDAKLRINREGKVTVLGNEVVSRARRSHKIRGGTVQIN